MTLKEVEELRIQNLAHTLRMPKCLLFTTKEDMAERTNVRFGVCYLIKNLGVMQSVGSEHFLIRSALKRAKGVKSFYGAGTKELPYTLKTKWGEGKFYNARLLFRNKEYPNFIEHKYCFANCYYMAKGIGESSNGYCKVLSGIAFIKDYPILHTVIETADGWIVDFNYDLVMEKKLYFSLFAFETLTELTSQEIFVKDKLLNKYAKFVNPYGHGYRVFALDDLIEYAEKRESNQVAERLPIGGF